MTKKPLSDTVCQRRLTKWIEGNYSEAEQMNLAYYDDVSTLDTYSFKYINPSTGERVRLTITRANGEITRKTAGNLKVVF